MWSSVTGTEEAAAKTGIPVADLAGGMYAYSSILAGLLQRERSGGGSVLHVSLFDGLCDWMGLSRLFRVGKRRQPCFDCSVWARMRPVTGARCCFRYRANGSGEQFCALVLERPEVATDARFADNTRRIQNREALRKEIESIFADFTAAEVESRMEQGQIAHARVRDMEEFWEHPQLQARGRIGEVESPVGPLPALLPATTSEEWPPRFDPIPATGEHTRALLTELGYGLDAIEQLKQDGVV